MIGVPIDSPKIFIRNTIICTLLIKSTLPNWPSGPKWFYSALDKITTTGHLSEEIQVDTATVTVIFAKELGLCTLSIKKQA
jgi:hypothetical protein